MAVGKLIGMPTKEQREEQRGELATQAPAFALGFVRLLLVAECRCWVGLGLLLVAECRCWVGLGRHVEAEELGLVAALATFVDNAWAHPV